MSTAYASGKIAEDLALEYLQQHNLRLIQRNFHSRFGEIDLIMRDVDGALVFVEVRQRRSGIDSAITSISPAKQKKLVKAAQFYLLKTGHDVACRFDVIAMDGDRRIQWLKNTIF